MNDKGHPETAGFLDLDAIKEMIPHRDPFLMIDEIRDLV
ncbi:MAG: 3-hydroxyacyl-[acyl-carrier-protein] dehydratase FabZ, partial [Rhodospirillales bacterium]|nr:3-hydroxyacyl-[acyl-carrier-protein] dehydratase FabZ [Rhodospirillales bacterium]